MATTHAFDAIIVGGGHNGLAAAAYLSRAGRKVLLLEKLDHPGGAAVSAQAFDGVEARLSRYSYLVSLLPQQIIDDLGLRITLARRRYSSYTPDPAEPGRALLIDNEDAASTAASFAAVGASEDEFRAFNDFYTSCGKLTQALWPTMTSPLPTRAAARQLAVRNGAADAWEAMIEQPVGLAIARALGHDLVRGVVLTDALIGTFARADDTDLQQNICFLYHLIGGGTGDWDVPIGGMGQVSGELEVAARRAGATVLTGVTVTRVTPDGEVTWSEHIGGLANDSEGLPTGTELTAQFDLVLSAVAPHVLGQLLGDEADAAPRPEGAQVKVNMLLSRLPRLRDGVAPEAAFGGTFHINEGYGQLGRAYAEAVAGRVPDPLPCEIYCHSLTDPSILGEDLRASGAQTLTVFGLHVPDRLLTRETNDRMRDELERAVVASLDSVLAEPIRPLLLEGAGGPAIETRTTLDIEDALAMPGGNIFHGPLSWPWLEQEATSIAEAWGAETRHPRILMAGSGARRGGAVSGIGGHNAAHAALELLRP